MPPISPKKAKQIHERFIRNIGTLSAEDQDKICDTKIGIAGCGLGSEIARQLIRFGFQISALADPDVVEIHNLNRQSYHESHVGKKKVEALLEKLQLIDSSQKPHLFADGITERNYKKFVELSDIIVDGIDPSAIHLSIAMTREAHAQKKTVITATDFGFGARLFIFPPDGTDIMDFLHIDKHTTNEAIKAMPVEQVMSSYMQDTPDYVMQIVKSVVAGELNYYPQNMLAVAQAAIMVVAACKRVTLQQPIIAAPKYIHVDIDMMLAGDDNHLSILSNKEGEHA